MRETHLRRRKQPDTPARAVLRCGTSFTFPKLKVLTLEHLLDFERWWETNECQEEQTIFPLLEKLFIRHCGNLIALPEAPLLEEPCRGGNRLVCTPFSLLENLFSNYCGKLLAFREALLVQEPCSGGYRLVRSAFPALKVLALEDLESLQRWGAAGEADHILFPQLETLSIQKCPMLTDLPEAPLVQEPCSAGYRLVWSAFPALKVLALEDLESLQRWDAAAEGEHMLFPQLEILAVKKCPKIIDLPEAPKLSVLEIEGGKQEIINWVDRYLSSLTKLTLNLEKKETTSEAECTSIVPVDRKEKWNQKSPLTVMELRCCNSFFGAGALESWHYFVHLEELKIIGCDVLVHWPEKVFQSLVSLRRFVIANCKNLIGYTEAPLEPQASKRSRHLPGLVSICVEDCSSLVEMLNVPASLRVMAIIKCPKLESIYGKLQGKSELVQGSSCSEEIMCAAVSELSSSPMNHSCPCLEDICLTECESLPAVLNLPPSLKAILVQRCSSIQILSCQLGGLQKPEVTTSINVPESSSSSAAAAAEHSLPPCLAILRIISCASMLGGILRLPTSLKTLTINNHSGFTSLESLLRAHPPSLKYLSLERCSTLAFLPKEPQAYRSLEQLVITGCPAIKKLPRCLLKQLDSICSYKQLDARYEVMALKPKTWKKIPRLVRERRQVP